MQETPQEYTRRILANVGGLDPLTVQSETPAKLERLVKGLPSSRLSERTAPANGRPLKFSRTWPTWKSLSPGACAQILGAPGTPIPGLRSGLLGRGRPLRAARPAKVSPNHSHPARSEPRTSEIARTRTVEAVRPARRAR